MKTLDLRALTCPHPVIQTRRELLDNPGTPLTVLVSDTVARDNICRLAASLNYLTDITSDGTGYHLSLTPGAAGTDTDETPPRRSILLLAADTLGSGDPELGHLLLKNYLCTLTEMDDLPEKLFLVNAGVRLVCQGADTLEALETLGCCGVDIAACGLCLEFYHLKDQLAVGRTTNMLEIATALQTAGHIIRL
jgi:selenium metabolism protein YedF